MTNQDKNEKIDEYAQAAEERLRNRKTAPLLINSGRKKIPLVKIPDDLDFSKAFGGTTYTVRSHFDPVADECLFGIVSQEAHWKGVYLKCSQINIQPYTAVCHMTTA